MANSFLDLIGLAHFKEKQSQQISKEFAKKSEVVTKADASGTVKAGLRLIKNKGGG